MAVLTRLRIASLVLALLPACDRNEPAQKTTLLCVPGETRSCTGPAGCLGGQTCKDDGSGYLACDCGRGDAGPNPSPAPKESRQAQCTKLLEAINAGNRRLADVRGEMAPRLRKNAKALRTTATELRALVLADAEVIALRDAYANLAERIADGSEATAKALESGEPATALSASQTVARYDEEELAFMRRLEKICGGEATGTVPRPVPE